jgi:TRAP-type C4-dicarboxylate transport system permease small subunit
MKRLLAAIETVAAIFLLLIALIISGNVLLRAAFSMSVPDWYDGARLLLGIAMFWGISLATYHGGHICVDAVWEMLNKVNRRRMDVIASLLTLAFLVPLAWMTWGKAMTTGTQTTSDLRLPLVWFFSVAAAGAVAAIILSAARGFELLRGHNPDPDPEENSEGSQYGS